MDKSEDITPDEESEKDVDFFDDTEADTPTEGNETNKDDKISDEAFLSKVNELEGRNYKSMEAYEKTLKERNKAFAQNPQRKRAKATPKAQPQNSVVKNLYFNANPEAKNYWDNVEKEAARLKTDPFELYESSEYMQGEAKALAVREENSNKLNTSPNVKAGNKEVSIESEEDLGNASAKERIEFFNKQVKKEQAGLH